MRSRAEAVRYYEKRDALPPGHVLSALAEALSITVDELVGNEPAAKASRRSSASRRLQRRLQQLEKRNRLWNDGVLG